jgi:ABC-2 type transport system ATP-binding protein
MVTERDGVVVVRGLSKRYGRVQALDNVDFVAERGTFQAVIGPNGAGKTTFIHTLTTMVRPDSGTVLVDGHDVVRSPQLARRRLGVVFQEPSLDTRLSAEENLQFHGLIFGVGRRVLKRRIDELLELVELTQWRSSIVRSLSRGMQRRLEIARALLHDSTLIVLDEPTVGLDPQTRARVWDYLRAARRSRELSVLVTTHYIDEVDDCDRVSIIDHGRILAEGEPEALKRAHGESMVRIEAKDEETASTIAERYSQATRNGRLVVIPGADSAEVGRIYSEHGTGIATLAVSPSTLERVFLDLTGRTIRDQASEDGGRSASGPRPRGEPIR